MIAAGTLIDAGKSADFGSHRRTAAKTLVIITSRILRAGDAATCTPFGLVAFLSAFHGLALIQGIFKKRKDRVLQDRTDIIRSERRPVIAEALTILADFAPGALRAAACTGMLCTSQPDAIGGTVFVCTIQTAYIVLCDGIFAAITGFIDAGCIVRALLPAAFTAAILHTGPRFER